jgi:hypothetical protein
LFRSLFGVAAGIFNALYTSFSSEIVGAGFIAPVQFFHKNPEAAALVHYNRCLYIRNPLLFLEWLYGDFVELQHLHSGSSDWVGRLQYSRITGNLNCSML